MHILGNVAKDQGRFQEALQCFRQGLHATPDHVHLLNSAGLLFRRGGYLQEARECFERAIHIDPNYYQGRYNLTNLCRSQGDIERAKSLYRQVLDQNDQFADAFANLSSVLEQEHQLDEAQSLAGKAVALDPANHIARVTLANIAKRRDRYDDMVRHVEPLLVDGRLSPTNFAVAAGLLAHAKERLGDYGKAFDLYQRANDALFETHAGPMKGLRSMYAPESLQTLHDFFVDYAQVEQPAAPDDYRASAFLLGFPRSGTTLLDQILSSHSRITVLEEKENLEAFYNRFPAIPDKLAELMSCPDAELREWRDEYWNGGTIAS